MAPWVTRQEATPSICSLQAAVTAVAYEQGGHVAAHKPRRCTCLRAHCSSLCLSSRLRAQLPASSFSVLKFPIPHLVKVMQVQALRCSRALTLPGILTVALPIQKVSD